MKTVIGMICIAIGLFLLECKYDLLDLNEGWMQTEEKLGAALEYMVIGVILCLGYLLCNYQEWRRQNNNNKI